MDNVQTVVIGAGAVGLSVARSLAMAGREVVVVEAADAIGTGTSSRNSEVIHAGLYYPTGSLKAKLCVESNAQLYEYAAAKKFDAKRCGKLIVATSDTQRGALEQLLLKAHANGVKDISLISGAQAREMEPAVACVQALWSQSSGIVDSHGLMHALQGDVTSCGGMIAFMSPFLNGAVTSNGFELHFGGAEPFSLQAREVINATGLYAPQVARKLVRYPVQMSNAMNSKIPKAFFAKGNYYALGQKTPFSRLIYPLPEAAGLGVHLTLDLAGQARFGPDVEWLSIDNPDDIDYQVNPERSANFYSAIRTYWPDLKDGALVPAYSGVRPKISGPSDPSADFMIQTEAEHGVAGLVNLFGIESPGLTASLAIGARVCAALTKKTMA
jgi:L-2-hydroxyglutarate oxidase LhgO